MHLFFHNELNLASSNQNELIELPEEEALHAIRVLRLQTNDIIFVTDGKGGMAECFVSSVTKKKLFASIRNIQFQVKKSYSVCLAVAPTKNMARFEWFLEKACEIGIDEIYPMECTHSERRNFNSDRTNKIITAAVKQSLKSFHPVLHPLTKFEDIINLDVNRLKFIAHYESENQASLKEKIKKDTSVLILIGPEGDFSKEEINLAKQTGFEVVSLGNTRLRTETAALFACFTANYVNL